MQYALMFYAEPGYAEALPQGEAEAVRAEFAELLDDPRCAPLTASTWTATSTSTPPAASCCAVSAATPRPERPTTGHWSWPLPPPNNVS